jgi:hypothetical protein
MIPEKGMHWSFAFFQESRVLANGRLIIDEIDSFGYYHVDSE